MPVAAGLGAHQPNRRLRLAAEPQTGRREVSALTDARKTLAYDFFRILRAPQRDQVIELAVTDIRGAVLLCTRLRPTVEIDPQAMGVHGITETELSNEPTWTQVAPALARLLSGRHLVIFNSSFDSRMLRQTASAFGDQLSWWQEQNCLCAMKLAADAFGSTNRHGTISLADATCEAGVSWKGRAHSAATDAIATADLVTEIAKVQRDLVVQLQELQSKGNLE
ncbi:3'-5' exonuclease [Enterobacter hormaechei]|uniref:3'-5' exonuclease n=1 Tax=Enterobacter hormaechei TaxID=158836 RepID=UPI003F4A6F0C